MELLVPLLSFCLGGAGALLVHALLSTLYRARIVRAVSELVAATMKANADELIGKARAELGAEAKDATDALVALRSERGRVMALLRHRGRASEASEEEEGEADEGGEPGFLDGLAQSFGVDVQRLAAGDPGELAKLEPLLAKLRGSSAPAALPGLPPGATYL